MNDTNASFLIGLSSPLPSLSDSRLPQPDLEDIVSSLDLSIEEKREILSSWASDAHAVADAPALRKLDNGQIAGIDDILDALKKLDAAELEAGSSTLEAFRRRRRNSTSQWLPAILRRRRWDDDDDPPPCPAAIAPSPRFPICGAESLLEAA